MSSAAIVFPARGQGWIKLSRRLLENPLFTEKPHAWLHIWLTILCRANWREGVFFDGIEEVLVPAGSWVTSAEKLATNTATKRQTIRSCLKFLEATNSITIRTTKRWTMISVTNWSTYQATGEAEQPTEQPTPQPTPGESPCDTATKWVTNTATTIKEIKKVPNTYKSKSDDLDGLQLGRPTRKSRRLEAVDPVIQEWFEQEFWPIYPRHEGKQPALKAAAAKATTPERRAFLIARLRSQLPAYAQRKADSGQRVIPLASTWFNQDRADDELLPAPDRQQRFQAPADDYPEYLPMAG